MPTKLELGITCFFPFILIHVQNLGLYRLDICIGPMKLSQTAVIYRGIGTGRHYTRKK